MIRATGGQIDEPGGQERGEAPPQPFPRRNKIHLIDEILNEFEMLNLAEEPVIPGELQAKVRRLVLEQQHPVAERPAADLRSVDWRDALYDVQDTLMLNDGDEPD